MILISWLSTSSATIPEGGDEISSTYESLILDGTVSEGYDTEAVATEHPVEEGSDITDHVRPGLRRWTFDVVVSAHPGPTSAAWQDAWTIEDEEQDRPGRVREVIDRLILNGIEVSIESGVRSWDSMLIISASEGRDANKGDGYRAMLIAREFRKVATEEVDAPSPRVERGRRRSDSGDQNGDSADVGPVSVAPADMASTLAQIREPARDFVRSIL